MSSDRNDLESSLHAYIDGVLDNEACVRIEQAMQTNAAFARKIEALRRQREGLRILFATLPEMQPETVHAERILRIPSFPVLRLRQGALAASLLCIGAAAGWSGSQMTTGPERESLYAGRADQVAMEGFSAHRVFAVDQRHPVEVGREEEAHLVAWLSNRMERKILAPDFSSAGLDLIGGRLLPSVNGPSAQLMYENKRGDRVTLYLRAGQSEPEDGVSEENGNLKAVLWSSHDLDYAVIGNVKTGQLLALSKLTGLEAMKDASKT